MKTTKGKQISSLGVAVEAARDKKAQDLLVLELSAVAAFTGHFLICSGASGRQMQSISDEIERRLKQHGLLPSHIEGYNHAEWILMDYADFVVHIFSEQARAFYNLERLWRTTRRVPDEAEL